MHRLIHGISRWITDIYRLALARILLLVSSDTNLILISCGANLLVGQLSHESYSWSAVARTSLASQPAASQPASQPERGEASGCSSRGRCKFQRFKIRKLGRFNYSRIKDNRFFTTITWMNGKLLDYSNRVVNGSINLFLSWLAASFVNHVIGSLFWGLDRWVGARNLGLTHDVASELDVLSIASAMCWKHRPKSLPHFLRLS